MDRGLVVVGASMEFGDLAGELKQNVLEEELTHEQEEKQHTQWVASRMGHLRASGCEACMSARGCHRCCLQPGRCCMQAAVQSLCAWRHAVMHAVCALRSHVTQCLRPRC
jgi:hypothetical protein